MTVTLCIWHLHYTSETYIIHQTLTLYIRHLLYTSDTYIHYTSDTYRKHRTLAWLIGYCHRCNRGREKNRKVSLCQEWWVATLQLANMFIWDRGQRSQQLERGTSGMKIASLDENRPEWYHHKETLQQHQPEVIAILGYLKTKAKNCTIM